jgi:hypothetical protein
VGWKVTSAEYAENAGSRRNAMIAGEIFFLDLIVEESFHDCLNPFESR